MINPLSCGIINVSASASSAAGVGGVGSWLGAAVFSSSFGVRCGGPPGASSSAQTVNTETRKTTTAIRVGIGFVFIEGFALVMESAEWRLVEARLLFSGQPFFASALFGKRHLQA